MSKLCLIVVFMLAWLYSPSLLAEAKEKVPVEILNSYTKPVPSLDTPTNGLESNSEEATNQAPHLDRSQRGQIFEFWFPEKSAEKEHSEGQPRRSPTQNRSRLPARQSLF